MTRLRQGTYSIVARDPDTGKLGVAVQSHWFSVGPIVPWALPGIGAVATQANADPSYGERALALIARGASAGQALAELLASDPAASSRQVAVVDAGGRVAAHTGSACIPFAGHATGEQVSCQANIMRDAAVWPAMLAAFEAASGPLASRLLDALDAAEAAGGDIRGRQSAAILVVPSQGSRWDQLVSLRVEDHPEPLAELRRLAGIHAAYELAGRADARAGDGRHDEAAELYRRACELAPENPELRFWAGLGTAQTGDLEAGLAQVREAIRREPGWAEVLPHIPPEVSPVAALVARSLG